MPVRRITLASAVRRFRAEADWCLRVVLSAALGCAPLSLRAGDPGPQGNVVAGDATFNHQDNYTGIRASDGAIIEYDKFNIPEGYTVEFIQPHELARVLNRVTGADPSSLLGNLRANGIVYFVNPAGIYFGKNAVIDVGQIYAAAGSLSNSDFLSRNDNFTRLAGEIANDGAIRAGAIHLVGQTVRNAGVLSAPAGLVMLAAGDDVLIGRRGEHVFVNATATSRAQAPGGAPGVENTGRVESARALLAAGDLYAMAVKNSGVIKSRDVRLEGQGGGEVWNTGTIDAANAAGLGGRVEITGRHVGLGGNSLIDASGATGGGEILVGGDYQGANAAVRNAEAAYVAEGATLRADATADGAGGKVVVWADDTTRFFGNISATGFSHGGVAEVSGKKSLLYAGLADLRAASGLAGTLLLDPDNLTISSGADTSTNTSGTFTAGGDGDYILNLTTLYTQLGLSNVEVKTLTGDIIVADAINHIANANSLLLNAGNDLNINASITLAGALSLRAGSGLINVGAGGGTFTVGSLAAATGTMRGTGANALAINTSGAAGTGRNGGAVTIGGIENFSSLTANADGGSGAAGVAGGNGGAVTLTVTGTISGNIDIRAHGGRGGDGTTSVTSPTGGGGAGGSQVNNSSYGGGGGGAGGAAGNAGVNGGNGDNDAVGSDNWVVAGGAGGKGGTAGGAGGNGGAVSLTFAESARVGGAITLASNGGGGGAGGNGENGGDGTSGGGGTG
ncbi:filamentous hemagglutinin N-terminal domain-containing protein, partial [Termitidicoccus mucosus]